MRPSALAVLVACAVAIGACERRAIAPSQIFDALQESPRLTDLALPLPLQSVSALRPHSIVTGRGAYELVGAVEVQYLGDVDVYAEKDTALATTELHTVSAEWKVDSDDSARVLYTRFSSAITRTLAREGECFVVDDPYPRRRLTRWANGHGTVWIEWLLHDTVPSLNGPTVRRPRLVVGVAARSRTLKGAFERLIPSPCI